MTSEPTANRRQFLRFLAASPLLPPGLSTDSLRRILVGRDPERALDSVFQEPALITAPEQALNVMDFEPVARNAIPPAHWAYLATGVDSDGTVRANREGFSRIALRPRRLRDVSTIDTATRVLGASWETPVFLSPTSSGKAFHPDGEMAVARAARAKGFHLVLSTVATSSIEDVTEACGAPVWFQLYPTNDWDVGRAMVQRAERAGSPALVVTVDLKEGSNRETEVRGARADTRQCAACHGDGDRYANRMRRKPMFSGLDLTRVTALHPPVLTWESIKRIRDMSRMKLIIKGILTRDDAVLAVRHGIDAIVVSNHGGRAEDANRSTIEALPEVLEGAGGRIPVLIDGGFRRGTDVFKALALGARGVGIGRPYLWGLGAFGQPGVEMVLELLRRELKTIMRQSGTRSIAEIDRSFVLRRS
jgi:isopentenyl diphosphate isomerase/L-lactate dehydrogenase-like FMN-dependent dehydrogenase